MWNDLRPFWSIPPLELREKAGVSLPISDEKRLPVIYLFLTLAKETLAINSTCISYVAPNTRINHTHPFHSMHSSTFLHSD